MSESPNPEPAPGDVPEEGRPPFNELSVLFPLLTIFTSGYLALMLADFMLKQTLDLPDGIMPVYIALLGAYAADKEIRRWLVNPEPLRKGSVFVYLWIIFFLGAYVVHTFRPDYELPANLVAVCLQVLGIFFGSRASKYVWEKQSGSSGEADHGRERQLMELIKTRGRVARREVMEELAVSHSTAHRLLCALERQGLIRRMGDNKGAYYVVKNVS